MNNPESELHLNHGAPSEKEDHAPGDEPSEDIGHWIRNANLGLGFSIVLTQGLNRQIRLMSEAFGYRVMQLRRVRIVNVRLGALRPGQWRNLTDAELQGLLPGRTDW